MTYTLTIVRNEPNLLYDKDEAKRQRNFGGYAETPEIVVTVLSMTVTPEQFDRIREACLREAK